MSFFLDYAHPDNAPFCAFSEPSANPVVDLGAQVSGSASFAHFAIDRTIEFRNVALTTADYSIPAGFATVGRPPTLSPQATSENSRSLADNARLLESGRIRSARRREK